MHIPSLIAAKRDGAVLTHAEIHAVITAFTSGEMPDYQMSALAMATRCQPRGCRVEV